MALNKFADCPDCINQGTFICVRCEYGELFDERVVDLNDLEKESNYESYWGEHTDE